MEYGRCGAALWTSIALYVLAHAGVAWSKVIPRVYRSAHLLGQGDAGITQAYDSDAIFYNPANLGVSRGSTWSMTDLHVLSPQVTTSSGARYIQENPDKFSDVSDNPLDAAQELEDRDIYVDFNDFNGAIYGPAGFGLYKQADLDLTLKKNPVTFQPDLKADVNVRAGFIYAEGLALTGDWSVGGTVKILQKRQMSIDLEGTRLVELQASAEGLDFQEQLVESNGTGVGLDIGATYQLPIDSAFNTEAAMVIQNVGHMSYDIGASERLPDAEKQVIHLGIGSCYHIAALNVSAAMDIRDITNEHQEVIFKRIHMGANVNWRKILSFSTGYNQGYSTWGTTLDLLVAKLSYTQYTEEGGDQPNEQRRDRRVVKLQLGWTK